MTTTSSFQFVADAAVVRNRCHYPYTLIPGPHAEQTLHYACSCSALDNLCSGAANAAARSSNAAGQQCQAESSGSQDDDDENSSSIRQSLDKNRCRDWTSQP